MFENRGNFIDGAWAKPERAEGTIERTNPSRRTEPVWRGTWSSAEVDRAVEAARRAGATWRKIGLERRIEQMRALKRAFEERAEELARAIAAEAGKPLWEATDEARALGAKIELMASEGLAYTSERMLDGGAARVVHRPLGVLAVLGPFNFPLHLPNGHIVPALLTGNTVVVKPSELTPGCMQLYAECVEAAGLPAGVFNLVQGPGPVGAALAAHPQVAGVLFTGSYETGLRIKRATLEQPNKLLALEMGGKNTSIVLADADLDQAAREITAAAYLTCGQRCTATSRVVADDRIASELIERLAALARRVTMGDALTEDVFMGPLIDERAAERFLAAQADDEGGKLRAVVPGERARPDLDGHFVRPALWEASELDPSGSHQAAELFGPDLVVYRSSDDAEAIRIANATEFGLAMSVFTPDLERYEAMAIDLEAGIVNLNRSTVGASSRLPFGGIKRSGNHRPAAITAGLYCTYPQAQLRVTESVEPDLSAAPFAYLSDE